MLRKIQHLCTSTIIGVKFDRFNSCSIGNCSTWLLVILWRGFLNVVII